MVHSDRPKHAYLSVIHTWSPDVPSVVPDHFFDVNSEKLTLVRLWRLQRKVVVYYESRKRELKTWLMNESRCDERLKARVEESTFLTYTGCTKKSPKILFSLLFGCGRKPESKLIWIRKFCLRVDPSQLNLNNLHRSCIPILWYSPHAWPVCGRVPTPPPTSLLL